MVARKNIMKGAAHGSSGASELKTRKAGLLSSAKIKKNLLLTFVFFFGFCGFAQDSTPLVDTNQSVTVQLATYNGTTLQTSDVITTLSDVPFRFLAQPVAVRFTHDNGLWSLLLPSLSFSNTAGLKPGNLSYSQRPVKDNVNGLAYPYKYFPRLQALFRFVESCYISGIASSAFDEQTRTFGSSTNVYCNVDIPTMLALCLSSTNGAFRSSVVDLLSSLRNSFSVSALHLEDISNSVVDFASSYEKANFYDFNTFDTVVDFASSAGYVSSSHAQSLKDHYSSLASDPVARQSFDRATRDYLRSASRVSNELDKLLSDDRLNDVGEGLNKGLQNSVDSGFSMSAHIQGAATNLLQKMTNQTEQIKQDLLAWRTDATNRLERQWDGIKKIRDDTSDISSGVGAIVSDGVKINGPVQVTLGTDNLHVDIANTDLDSLVDGFANGSDAAMQRWLDEWEMFKADQIPYMGQFSAFFDSNTNLLSSIDRRVDFGFTNTLDSIYVSLTNGLDASITNELWDYYFDRFKKANEFKDDDGQLFTSIDNQRHLVFGNGFDEAEYKKLDWFSRVELLLYQIGYASTNGTESIEAPDLEGEFDDVSDEIQIAASEFEGAARRVVGVFSLVGRFADAVKNAFADVAAPSTDGILLLEGGSWIFEEPLYLRVPVLIQNALRLVFQCVWYLSAFVIGWRLVSFAWGRVASLVRWLWSLIDV